MNDPLRVLRAYFGIGLLLCVGCGSSGGGGAPSSAPPPEEPGPAAPAGDSLGFVFTSFGFDYPSHDEEPCPLGWNLSPREEQVQTGVLPPDDCQNPEANQDPDFLTLEGSGRIQGFDLDGLASTNGAPVAGECRHQDFTGPAGEPGVDYQLWRAIGCIRGFQRGGIVQNVQDDAVINGEMTILLELSDIDDPRNDDEVRVQIFASTDSPPLGSDGKVLPYGSLDVHEEARFHSETAVGRLVDGVLQAGPIDLLLRLNIQIVDAELPLHDAWVRVELLPDGSARGQIHGYWPVEAAYEVFGYQAGYAAADALAYTCTGLYAALKSHADGGFDPASGACSSLSTIYQFTALPAFVVK
ncbi:MAG: hypothetical protein FJ144_12675 [Deltaproteobacteria bacterium]|nr:hypothetical protein [Deltaproteobacteria bacterium]